MKIPKLKLSRKAAAIGLTIGIAAGAGGIAAAYYTATGTGTGTATVKTSTTTVTLKGTTVSTLTLGGTKHVHFKVTNGTGSSVYVTKVYITHVEVTGTHSDCLTTWFTFGAPTEPVGKVETGTTAVTATTKTPTIKLDTETTNQDACKGATVTIYLTTTTPT